MLALDYQRLKGRKLIAIPIIISALFLACILIRGVTLGRDFKGGSLVMVQGVENMPSVDDVKSAITGLLGTDVDVLPVENGLHIETGALDGNGETNVKSVLSVQFGVPTTAVTISAIGPIIPQIEHVLYPVIAAFIVMGVFFLIIFRRRIVPATILLVIALDVICVLGYMALLRLPLSLASTVGILVLICYAIDTNVMLAWRVLKRVGGEPREQAAGSMSTGLTMGVIMVAVLLVLNIITGAMQLNVLTAVLIFGIAINILNTWLLGAGIILGHAERRQRKDYHVSV